MIFPPSSAGRIHPAHPCVVDSDPLYLSFRMITSFAQFISLEVGLNSHTIPAIAMMSTKSPVAFDGYFFRVRRV